jgi:hypothetical protein
VAEILDDHNSRILRRLDAIEEDIEELTTAVEALPTLEQIRQLIEGMLGIPGFPVKFDVTITQATQQIQKEYDMAAKVAKKHSVSLEILENGTVRYTATPTDANGNPTTLPAGSPPATWASSDPDLTLASDPQDTSGFNLLQIGTAGTSPATGVVATITDTITNPADGSVSTITGAADPVNIVPAPPGFPTSFVVTEA